MGDRTNTLGSKLRGLADKIEEAVQALADALNPPTPVRIPVAMPPRRRGR